jgi:riboflavin kinase / FMN adenylyltransferase
VWITSSLDTVQTPTFIALGNFDGVHRGHRRVIEPVLSQSVATVVTFFPHPQEFFSGQRRPLLTPLDEKVAVLRSLGVEQLVLLPFGQELASMPPVEFVEIILLKQLQAHKISVGQDFCFGCRRSGTTKDLQAIAGRHGVAVEVIPLYIQNGDRISSSAIRQALQDGDLGTANQLLGRPYTLMGKVIHGQQLGRTIGFPTANLQLPPEKFLPRQGVYSVQVQCCALPADERLLPGVMNIGYRPTVDGVKQTIEIHLLDWSGDLYDQTLTVSLDRFLRPEQKFPSLDALKAQIQLDCDMARSLLTAAPSI